MKGEFWDRPGEAEAAFAAQERIRMAMNVVSMSIAGARFLRTASADEKFFSAWLIGSRVEVLRPLQCEPLQEHTFFAPWLRDHADLVVGTAVKQMVVVTYDAIKIFAKEIGRLDEILRKPAVALCKHLRHAIAHNGRWDLSSGYYGVIRWGSIELDRDRHANRDIDELVSLQDMLELAYVLADWLQPLRPMDDA